ncbi:hypothetical protein HanRHA438_Chr17g0801231 [Helianthus annuus]|nr:hypothetical protein HanRHA438_Chr17g0801231 [Helianthus annuus]
MMILVIIQFHLMGITTGHFVKGLMAILFSMATFGGVQNSRPWLCSIMSFEARALYTKRVVNIVIGWCDRMDFLYQDITELLLITGRL